MRLVVEADADAEHAADHIVQRVVGVLATDIRRTGVGDVVDLGIELGRVAEIPVEPDIQVQDRADLVEVDGRRLDRRGRAGAGGADDGVAVGGDTPPDMPAFRQVDAPDVVLVALGLLQLPVQDVAA